MLNKNKLIATYEDESFEFYYKKGLIEKNKPDSSLKRILYGWNNGKEFCGINDELQLYYGNSNSNKKDKEYNQTDLNGARRIFLENNLCAVISDKGYQMQLSLVKEEGLKPIDIKLLNPFSLTFLDDKYIFNIGKDNIVYKHQILEDDQISKDKNKIEKQLAQEGNYTAIDSIQDKIAVGTDKGEIFILDIKNNFSVYSLFQVDYSIDFLCLTDDALFAGNMEDNVLFQWIKDQDIFPLLPNRTIKQIIPDTIFDFYGGINEIGFWTGEEFMWRSLVKSDFEKLNKLSDEEVFNLDRDTFEYSDLTKKEIQDQINTFFETEYIFHKIRNYLIFDINIKDNQVFFEITEEELSKKARKQLNEVAVITLKTERDKIGHEKRWKKELNIEKFTNNIKKIRKQLTDETFKRKTL